jgi:uncharacterized protein YjaG (DUF416 family)
METSFDSNRVVSQSRQLSSIGRIAFILSCAERLQNNYLVFAHEQGWGHVDVIPTCLDLVWGHLSGGALDRNEVVALRMACDRATPATDEFDSAYVSAALDAASVCDLLLLQLLKDDLARPGTAAELCVDTVDMYVQDTGAMNPRDPFLEDKILQHPLMQNELKRQREDLAMLALMHDVRTHVSQLEARWRRPSVSNLGLARPA